MIVKKWIDVPSIEVEVEVGPDDISDLLLEDEATTKAQCLNIVSRAWDALRTVDPRLLEPKQRETIAAALDTQAARYRAQTGINDG